MMKYCIILILAAIGFFHNAPASIAQQLAPREEDMAAYLLVYFKDATHSLHFALSADGYSFTDINNGEPVINGEEIAEQRGVRDPYIMRGPDNVFYMAMTDLHIYAHQRGLREQEWQRARSSYGWGNNRALVLMKSTDLINWSHAVLRVDQAFPGLAEIGCAWAPELIYDHKRGKIMLYFTIRFGNGQNDMYYTYMNEEFNEMETAPELLFKYPTDCTCIDGDITRVGDKFHLFYVPHDGTPGIKQAVSEQIFKGYVYDPEWYDAEEVKCEAPNVWKRIGEDKWVLMYDIYGLRPPNFGFRETSDFKHFTDLGRFNEGPMKATNFESPKHGSVIQVTKQEATKLCQRWGLKMTIDGP